MRSFVKGTTFVLIVLLFINYLLAFITRNNEILFILSKNLVIHITLVLICCLSYLILSLLFGTSETERETGGYQVNLLERAKRNLSKTNWLLVGSFVVMLVFLYYLFDVRNIVIYGDMNFIDFVFSTTQFQTNIKGLTVSPENITANVTFFNLANLLKYGIWFIIYLILMLTIFYVFKQPKSSK